MMNENISDTTPPEHPVGAKEDKSSSAEQLQADIPESVDDGNVNTDMNVHESPSLNDTSETAREASTKGGGEESDNEALAQIEGCKVEETGDVQTPGEEETKKSDGEQNIEEAISDVVSTVEKNDNEVDNVKDNADATNGEEMKDSVAQQSPTSTVSNVTKDESKPTTPVKDAPNSTSCVGGEVLFTDQGWNQLWAAIPDKEIRFTAPVLRVEAGRFFWSSKIYNKRVLAIYKQPDLILVLRLPADIDEVRCLRGSETIGHSSFLVAESVIDPKTSKIRLSQLTHPTSLPLKTDRSKGLQNIRKRTCFDILTPTEVIELSAAFLPNDSFDNIEYASEKCLSDTYRFEHAISEALLSAQTDSYNMMQHHQIILGTPHSYVIGGNDQVLKEALSSALELQRLRGVGGAKLDSNIIDERDSSGNTALHYACLNRRSSTVSILVGAGSNCSVQTSELKTPCHIAASSLDTSSLSIMLSAQFPRPDPNALDSKLRTPMFVAAVEGRTVDGRDNGSALDQCLSALAAWGGQLMLGNTNHLHPINLIRWNSAKLRVILSHCHYHYPLLSGLAGISASALYHYPLHCTMIQFREQMHSALSSSDELKRLPSEADVLSRLQTLLDHGFEPNERLEGIFCEGNESKQLTAYFGYTPLQILLAAAKDIKSLDSCDEKEENADFSRVVRNIIEIIHKCTIMLVEKGARLNMPPPPGIRLDRDTPLGCYSLEEAMEGTENSKVPPVSRDEFNKIDKKDVIALLGGVDRLKAPQKRFSSLPKTVDSSAIMFQFGTTSIDSNAPGGSDETSCAICWSEFGIITNRKHLCRASGRYVCNDCSTKRLLDNGTEQRISDGLFNLVMFELRTGRSARKPTQTSQIGSKPGPSSTSRSSSSATDRNRSFLGLSSSSSNSATETKQETNLSATERITSAIAGLGQAKDAVLERGAKLEGLAEKTEALNNASVDFMNMAKELERQQNSWW